MLTHFRLQPTSYASDQAKIAYTLNLLRGKAAQWGTALWEVGSEALDSHEIFVTEMKRVFDHPIQGSEAATRLLSLRQDTQSAANYSVDFCILAVEMGLNEPAFVSFFKRGLSGFHSNQARTHLIQIRCVHSNQASTHLIQIRCVSFQPSKNTPELDQVCSCCPR